MNRSAVADNMSVTEEEEWETEWSFSENVWSAQKVFVFGRFIGHWSG
jgi:hypothetical protein